MSFSTKKIEDGFKWLQSEFSDTDVQQSPDDLVQKLNIINTTLAWSYEQMATAKKILNEAKAASYVKLNSHPVSMGKLYSPSLAKDYIASNCSKEAYNYDLTERFCRALVHISDNLRTSISCMKELAKMEANTAGVGNVY